MTADYQTGVDTMQHTLPEGVRLLSVLVER